MGLAAEVRAEFEAMLGTIAGTKESIRQAKDWMLSRPADVTDLARALREHVEAWADREDADQEERFTKILYAIYLLNDVFFNSGNDDPYRFGCLGELPAVMAAAREAAFDDGSRDRVSRVIDLWGSKKVFGAADIETLRSARRQPPAKPPAPAHLASWSDTAVMLPEPEVDVAPQRCDLASVPVGVMAGLVKVALSAGHEPWKPIDVSTMPSLMPPAIEPARLEARVNEFYRVLEKERAVRAEKRAAREKELLEDDRNFAVLHPLDDVEDQRSAEVAPTTSRVTATPAEPRPAPQPEPIGDENLGKKMLRGMGWEEGRGLGVAGRGRAEPINDAGQTDKIGIGLRKQDDEPDIYAQYRTQRGSSYRSRWNS